MTGTNDCEGESREKDGTKWGETLDAGPSSYSVGSGAGNTWKIDNKLSVRLCHLLCSHCVYRWSKVERGWDGGIWKTRLAFAFYLLVISLMSLQPSHTRTGKLRDCPFPSSLLIYPSTPLWFIGSLPFFTTLPVLTSHFRQWIYRAVFL